MKLRSAQFVLLVLLFTSLSFSEGSTLRLADNFLARATVSARTLDSTGAQTFRTRAAAIRRNIGSEAISASALATSKKPWTMRAPAAHAAQVEAVSGLAQPAV